MEKYLLHEKVGEGLLGEVFKAIQIDTKQICAIKIIHLDQPPEDPEDVQKELNFLKTCDSQYIIKYYETILKGDTLYLVMEYVTPGSLKDYLNKVGPISETYISMILREMLNGLEYLQTERRCHRNLKASNVLLSDKGEVKLCDLAVGGSLGDATRLESVARAPYWIAPEVMNGNPKVEKLDKQDIWSIGITAYEIATGVTPYHNHEPMKMNLLLAREDPPRLEGEFSRSFKDFVNLCLNKEVKKRPSIKELLTHPFIRKSKKIYNLLDMVGKLNRQSQRLSQRVIDTSSVAGPTAAAANSPKRGRAFSASSIMGKLRDGDDGSNELGGTLTYGTRTTHSPSFDSTGHGPKIGVTLSRLKGESGRYGSLGRISASHPAPSSSSSSSSTRPASTTPTSAFTPTTPTAIPFAPSTTAIPPTTTTTTTTTSSSSSSSSSSTPSSTPLLSSSLSSLSNPAIIPKSTDLLKHSASSSIPSPTTTTTTTSSLASSSSSLSSPPISTSSASKPDSTPSITVTPSTTTPSSTPSSSSSAPKESVGSSLSASSSLIPPPTASPSAPLVSSGSNENINESDFPSFLNPLSPPLTPKIKTPLLTTPPTSSFLDSVILPVLDKKGRSYTEETQVLNELKDAFKRLEASRAGASQQLVNDWVEAVLWENYTQPERGSPMANYLLLRWKNGTPL